MKRYKNKFADFEFTTFYVTSEEDAKKVVGLLMADSKVLRGLDTETAKREEFKEHKSAELCPHLSMIRLLQIYDPVFASAYVFDLFSIDIEILRPILEKGHFCAHYGVFEIMHLTHAGFPNMNIGCSMLLSQIIEGAEHSPFEPVLLPGEEAEDDTDQSGLSRYKSTGHSLDSVTQRLFGYKVSKTQQVSDWGKDVLDVDQIVYAALDAVLTYKAAKTLASKIAEYKMQKAYRLLKDMQHVVAQMQLEGLPVDWEYHGKMIAEWQEKSLTALEKCKPFFGETNMRSGKQMSNWLKEYLKDDVLTLAAWPTTPKGAYAFSKKTIAHFTHLPAISTLLDYKKYAKLIDTYGESIIEKKHPITQRLHTSYTLGETRTGRLSSRNPNCQNYPCDTLFRNMFSAVPGYVLVVSDFSQIELRLQAEFSKDPAMLKVYKTKGDIYSAIASEYFGIKVSKENLSKHDYKEKRMFGKVVMLALGYGMSYKKLALYASNSYGLNKPLEEWQKAYRTYHKTFGVYSKWCDKMRDRAKALGYIETLLGKRRKLTEDEMYTCAPNTVIQGSAAELMMKAMIICQQKLGSLGKIVATVHDEILIHCIKENAESVKKVLADSMNSAMKELFPKAVSTDVADASFAVRWGEAKADL